MNVVGERIVIFGDSLSHHGADDAPEIWDVNAGSNRASSAPGDILASMLLEAGAQAVRIDANARVALCLSAKKPEWPEAPESL
jgi:hypothetical protein